MPLRGKRRDADIIIGYRADDSYTDIVDAFMSNRLSVDEVERLFKKGELGEQVFIKSPEAFQRLKYLGCKELDPREISSEGEIRARSEGSRFLRNRAAEMLLNGYTPYGITATGAAKNVYEYYPDYNYYALPDEREIGRDI